ncbi:hypothetical protein B2I21_13480 [Chryseobacterium mucoviscidosis]|uniref:hypothetical protein n=1 Tax=Paenibacillus sp. 11B TaxID=3060965 RepID=UPI0009A3D484|nr:hypothetical protein [Paenibacillus sp. 11B]MDN8592401.1 hypothetical protein [Paenibacillus sp. 11B]OPG97931.1 hypothetical protein B2I21_13480 [Chryseobacterium mucoviscidosis]
MDSMTYYVSVMGRSVIPDPYATSYEWVIHATPQEAEQLLGLLNLMQEKEEEAFPGMVFPLPEESVNRAYESVLQQVYREIYRLGTPETRYQIEQST